MGIETEQRLRQLEQRLTALESDVRTLRSLSVQPAPAAAPLAEPPAAKRAGKTSKSRASASGANRRV